MDDIRIGLAVRALRERRGWRQSDLAERAGVSQSHVSLLERGRLLSVSTAAFRRVMAALDARAEIRVTWQGGEIDRLLDRRHARIVESVIRALERAGWQSRAEVTFSHYGDRGSIDVLAWSEAAGAILLIEVKSQVYSVEETLRRFQIKVRLASFIAEEQLGWRPRTVGTALVLPESAGTRRRVDDHATTFASAFPQRGRDVHAWLRAPVQPLSAIWFLSATDLVAVTKSPVRRIRPPRDLLPSDTYLMGIGAAAAHDDGARGVMGRPGSLISVTGLVADRSPELARAGFILDRSDRPARR